MTDNTDKPLVLLTTKRNNIVDCQYYGSFYLACSGRIILHGGYNQNQSFFMRSLAKPLQAAICCDYNFCCDFKIKDYELAVMTGSHSGSLRHIEILKKLIKKHHIKISDLELAPLEPLDMSEFRGIKTKLHNNCSGKHIMMILMCKYLGIDIKNYTNENHKIQKLIKLKQEELSESNAGVLSFDGCSTPLWAISASGIVKSYYNLLNCRKYNKIINSAIKNPYLFGGHGRLDTEIIKLGNGNLYSKVGANGFLIVCNIALDMIFLLKLTQNNNDIRRLIALDALNKLGWIKFDIIENEYNQKGQCVAKYCYEINFNGV